MRFKKISELITPRFFAQIIKSINQKRLNTTIAYYQEKRNGFFDPYVDHNKIVQQIVTKHIFKIIRIGSIALMVAYFVGLFWWIFIEIEMLNDDYFQTNGDNFI